MGVAASAGRQRTNGNSGGALKGIKLRARGLMVDQRSGGMDLLKGRYCAASAGQRTRPNDCDEGSKGSTASSVVASNRRKLASYIGEYLYFTKSDHPDGKVMWAIITCWNTKSRKSKLYIRKSMRIIRDESFR